MSRTIQLFGPTGSGKTTIALTAEGLKWYAELDPGSFSRAAAGLSLGEGEIDVGRYDPPMTALEDLGALDFSMTGQSGKGAVQVAHRYHGWREQYGAFIGDFLKALKDKTGPQTLIIDTSTLLWTMAQNSLRQRIQDEDGSPEYKSDRLKRLEYEEPNNQFTAMVQGVKTYNKNLILIAHRGERWFNDKPTGVWKPDGWNQAMDESDASFMIEVQNHKPTATVMKAGGADLKLVGRVVTEPTMPRLLELLDAAQKLRSMKMGLPETTDEIVELAAAL